MALVNFVFSRPHVVFKKMGCVVCVVCVCGVCVWCVCGVCGVSVVVGVVGGCQWDGVNGRSGR